MSPLTLSKGQPHQLPALASALHHLAVPLRLRASVAQNKTRADVDSSGWFIITVEIGD